MKRQKFEKAERDRPTHWLKYVEVNGHGVNVLVYIKISASLVAFSPFQYHTQLPFYSK